MRFVTALLGLTLLIISQDAAQGRVYLGNEVLAMRGYETLRGKRVGLLTNPSGVDGRGRSVIDILHNTDLGLSSQVNANVFLECMEKGQWGNTQAEQLTGLMAEYKQFTKQFNKLYRILHPKPRIGF